MPRPSPPTGAGLYLMVALSGVCGLTWEVLWQHHAGLALGVSARGAAITLAAIMGGIGIGGLLAARLWNRGQLARPMLTYALAELAIGLWGLLVPGGFSLIAGLDTALYQANPTLAEALQPVLVGSVLLPPSIAMGVTIPVLAPVARRVGSSIAVVYALNTAGAVGGVLLATFVALPLVGVQATGWMASGLNVAVAAWAATRVDEAIPIRAPGRVTWPPASDLTVAFISGAVIFALEVSWFRSIRAAFHSTTESFAVILASFLMCLSVGAWLAGRLGPRYPGYLPWVMLTGAFAVLVLTPPIDALDGTARLDLADASLLVQRATRLVHLVFAPVVTLGMVFPWLLARHDSTSGAGQLYALNTVGAVVGALVSGFLLLPAIGATQTSLLAGLAMAVCAWAIAPSWRRAVAFTAAIGVGLVVVKQTSEGTARTRVQGQDTLRYGSVLFVHEGPESTVWVADRHRDKKRSLIIDGFRASSEGAGVNYMRWMGHLPAMAAPGRDAALVICFGTGQTANAVRREGFKHIDLVDLNSAVFDAAHLFDSNQGVLQDPNVHTTAMDGRAFLRRASGPAYDVITLEPMPPNFAGVNNLYSAEFYALLAKRLKPGGVTAQWVPYHLISPSHMRSIIATFHKVFPYTRLWHDPLGGTGVLVGSREPWELRTRPAVAEASLGQVRDSFVLDSAGVSALAATGTTITDDNQRLSYGLDRLARSTKPGDRDWYLRLATRNQAIVNGFRGQGRSPQ